MRLAFHIVPALMIGCCVNSSVLAQVAQQNPEIVTDRPSVTPAPTVIPQNYIQAENGLALRLDNGAGVFNVPQTLIRLGVLPKTELRLTAPNYFLIRGANQNLSGVEDISVGVKQQLGPLFKTFNLAVIPGMTVPTGSKSLTSRAVDPFIQIVFSQKLSKNWTIGGAQSLFHQTEAAIVQDVQFVATNKKAIIYQPTVIVNRNLGARANVFWEYVGNFERGETSDQLIDSGFLYRFKRNQQVSLRFGFGLTRPAPITFIEFGYSFLVGKLIR